MEKVMMGHGSEDDCLEVRQVLQQQAKSRSIGHTRRLIKAEPKEELGQIAKLVRQILGSNGGSRYTTSQRREL